MEITSRIAVEPCPRCKRQPQMLLNGRFQVSCACGACGPEARSAHDAAHRWQSVAHYLRHHQAYFGEQLQVAVREEPPAKRFPFPFTRNW